MIFRIPSTLTGGRGAEANLVNGRQFVLRQPGKKLFLLALVAWLTGATHLYASVIDEAAVVEAMNQSGRLAADIARDPRSRPEKVIPLLNLEQGDRALDIFAGGGYFSELLARVLGPEGEAVLHNNMGFEAWGVNELTDRFYRRNPGNVKRHTTNGINLDMAPESLDAALIVMALHDLYVVPKRYNGQEYVPVGEPMDAGNFLEQVFLSLKPGGRFVVVDHAGEPGMEPDQVADLHRMEEGFARREVESRGFRFVTSSTALHNPDDDRQRIVFDEDLRGQTDRFVLVLENPECNRRADPERSSLRVPGGPIGQGLSGSFLGSLWLMSRALW